jgi:hypothetical protein
MFEHFEDNGRIAYFLIKNKEILNGKYLFPEKYIIDFFLFIQNNCDINIDDLYKKLKNINEIQTVIYFNSENLPSLKKIIF